MGKRNLSFIETVQGLKGAGTPIVGIETSDEAKTIQEIMKTRTGETPIAKGPAMAWNIIQALYGLNKAGKDAVRVICDDGDPQLATGNPAELLSRLVKAPEQSLVFMQMAHKYYGAPQGAEAVIQGIWNLRDIFKARNCMLILLAPTIFLPIELKDNVMVITEPLPDREAIKGIVNNILNAAATAVGTTSIPTDIEKFADGLTGLSAFAAEQTVASSVYKGPNNSLLVDTDLLWEKKRRAIEQTKGLSVLRGPEKFADIGGCENVKWFLRATLEGKKPPKLIMFWDEIEKSFAGSSQTDTSNVDKGFLGSTLQFMQDYDVSGMIFIGPPGAAKSAIAKATGNEADIMAISFDPGAMKGSLVGESEANFREALKVLLAVSSGELLVLATCNSITSLPPELRRRFGLTFFFDLPTEEERALIWNIYIKKYELNKDQCDGVDDIGWTGAEIRKACKIAWELGLPISKAARFIVPVFRSASATIKNLREEANGKFTSASYEGEYQYEEVRAEKIRKLDAAWMK